MKKRVKLLTTIASLCLAVALMAFGVYAATKVNFTTTSTVSFTASGIKGEWYFGVHADGATLSGTQYGLDSANDAPTIKVLESDGADKEEVLTLTDVELTDRAADGSTTLTYVFAFKITGDVDAEINVGCELENINATLADGAELEDAVVVSAAATDTTDKQNETESKDTALVKITVTINNNKINLANDGSVKLTFTATAEVA